MGITGGIVDKFWERENPVAVKNFIVRKGKMDGVDNVEVALP